MSEGFCLKDFVFLSKTTDFPSLYTIQKDTKNFPIKDLDFGVDVQCCGSQFRVQNCKSLICLADSGVDFYVAVASIVSKLPTEVNSSTSCVGYAFNKYWVTV